MFAFIEAILDRMRTDNPTVFAVTVAETVFVVHEPGVGVVVYYLLEGV
jgi:hypothetical protein